MASHALAAQPVEGHVVNALTGAGIQKATARIFPADVGPANALLVTTDSQGRFRIESMEVGAYRVTYEAPGFRGVPEGGGIAPPFQVGNGAEPVRLEVKMQQLGELLRPGSGRCGRTGPKRRCLAGNRGLAAPANIMFRLLSPIENRREGGVYLQGSGARQMGAFRNRATVFGPTGNRTPISNSAGRRPSSPAWSIHRMPKP